MSVEESPEFKKALQEACEAQYRGWLYGGGWVKAASKDEIGPILKEIKSKKEEAEKEIVRIRRQTDSIRKGLPKMPALGLVMPQLPTVITDESMKEYRRAIESYSDTVRGEAEIKTSDWGRKINENLRRAHGQSGGLVCPQCGETDSHGNWMNGKPFCFRCQLPMMPKEKAEKWVKPAEPKNWMDDFGKIDQCRVRK